MNYIKSNINLDLAHKAIPTTIHTVQLDSNTRIISASLFNNGQKWIPWEGATICLSYQKPDGTSGFYSELENGEVAATITDNTISIKLADQVLTVAGIVNASIVFIDDIYKRISTPVFQISVEKSTSLQQLPSNDYYAVSSIAELNEIVEASLQEVSDAVILANTAMNDAIAAAKRMDQTTKEILTAKQDGEFKGDKGDKGDKGEKGDPYGNIPLVRFDLTHNMLDVSGDMVLPDGNPWNFTRNPVEAESKPGMFTTLDQVHALYDDLCDKYDHLWSKCDAAAWVGMEYPTYANGISMSNNLFDRDKVLFDFLYEKVTVDGKEVSKKRRGTEIYLDWLSGQVDIITGESAPGHTISESNLKKMMWLKKGIYVLSYGYELESGDSCTLRVAYVNGKIDGTDTYSYKLIEGDMSGDNTKRWYAFQLPYDSYCTIMRSTINVKAKIYDIMLEKMDVDSVGDVEGPSDYEYYGQVAYKYPLGDDVVCNGIYPADVTDEELQKDGLTVADLRIHTYKPTPAYKTFLYKFSFDNDSMHSKPGLANAKKKIFLTSSVNGDERTAPFNSYLFCKRLCEVFAEKTADGDYYYDDDYFKFAQAFDVYIVPCINGYGLYHNTRWNANGVQIDRNFDTGHWVAPDRKNGGVTFVPETQDYPGVAPDSEFETRLIEKLTEKIKPDMAIDLHNYTSTLPRQFYTGVAWKKWMPLLYQSCVDCSIAFKKHFPQYFGTGIDLVRDSRDYRLEYEALNGEVTTWWRTKGNVYFPSLIEVCQTINYNNGELVGTWDNGKYNSASTAGLDLQGADTFSVAEYTVRNQLMRYGQFTMENQPKE